MIRFRYHSQTWISDDGVSWRRSDGEPVTAEQQEELARVFDAAPKPLKRAAARGHDLRLDPPANTLANVNRFTCKDCGRAVLWGTGESWGSALEEDCKPR